MINKNKENSRFDFSFRNYNLLKSKRSQVTIFIIIGVLIIAAVLLVLFLWRGSPISTAPSADPESYIDSCVKDSVKEALSILSKQGGDIKQEGTITYKGENITYLCYTSNYYSTCVNQRPLLIEHIEKEITSYIDSKVNSCFASLTDQLQTKGYEVSSGSQDLKTELQTGRIIVTINRNFELTKDEKTTRFDKFTSRISSPIYELAEIAMEVVNQEARYCNFENLGFMIIYPQYDIRKESASDSTLIYTITDLPTNKQFKFAIRSCALPAGL